MLLELSIQHRYQSLERVRETDLTKDRRIMGELITSHCLQCQQKGTMPETLNGCTSQKSLDKLF